MSNYKPVLCFWSPTEELEIEKGSSVLSNWHPSPTSLWQGKIKTDFPTSEHHYMAIKALTFGDEETFKKLKKAETPKEAKELGRQVANFNEGLWDAMRYEAMVDALRAKFFRVNGYRLKQYLLSTYPRLLAEASPYDKVWGIGLKRDDENAQDPSKWTGQNLLGKALMQVRSELRLAELYYG